MKREELRQLLKTKGMKVTPQRMAVLEAIKGNYTHPCTEGIIETVREEHPDIAIGTVYHILDTFVEKGLIRKVKTDKEVMRYDAIPDTHHHLYCIESDRIEDYFDGELDELLQEYFRKKHIPGFRIQDMRVQIMGNFSEKEEKH